MEIENVPEKLNIKKEARLGIDAVYESATGEHEALKQFPRGEIKQLIGNVLQEIELLEEIAERDYRELRIADEVAKKIEALWVLSGPGTYDDPVKEDRYKNYPWARGMDRARLNYAARIARRVAEARSGEAFNKGGLSSLKERKELTKQAISESGPYIIYNGRPDENEVVRDVLTREGIIIPKEKVMVIGEDIDKSVDQVKTIRLPEDFSIEHDELAIISHAPQLARIVRMINRYKPFPEGTKIRLLPVPTPEGGKAEYALMETRGILYYTFLSPDRDTTKEPFPYSVNQLPQEKEKK